MANILVIVAHPDDEVLGCGGTIARLAKQGNQIHTLILGEGIRARHNVKTQRGIKKEINKLKKQAREANRALGVKKVSFFEFPDNKFDKVALLDIIKTIEQTIEKFKPRVIFTHWQNDLNIDHQLTFKAVITAARPLPNKTIKEIYSFEVLSSSEWNDPFLFAPNVFFDISRTIAMKLKAMQCYKSEIKVFRHPRSLEGIQLNARVWGMKAGIRYAEAFRLIRLIK